MKLQEILQKLVEEKNPLRLSDGNTVSDAGTLLTTLSSPMLNRQAYMQPGLYIAEINEAGYLGRVLFKFTAAA